MTNEYGTPLDRNGYAPSILQENDRCYINEYHSGEKLDRHEPFGGPYRQKSKRLGIWVLLCHCRCHQFGPEAVHQNAAVALNLKQEAQLKAMEHYGWTVDEFRAEFGKSYL